MSAFLNKKWLKQELMDELNRVLHEVQVQRTDLNSIGLRFSLIEQSGYRAQVIKVVSVYDPEVKEIRLIISDKDHAINSRVRGEKIVLDILDFDIITNQKVSVLGHPQDLNYSQEVKHLIMLLKEYIVPKPIHSAWGEFTAECLAETVGKANEDEESIKNDHDEQHDEYHDPAMVELLASLVRMEDHSQNQCMNNHNDEMDIPEIQLEIEKEELMEKVHDDSNGAVQENSFDVVEETVLPNANKNEIEVKSPQILLHSTGNVSQPGLQETVKSEITDDKAEITDIDDEIQTQDGSVEDDGFEVHPNAADEEEMEADSEENAANEKTQEQDIFSTQNVNTVDISDDEYSIANETSKVVYGELSTQNNQEKKELVKENEMEIDVEDDRDLIEKAYDEFENEDLSSSDEGFSTQAQDGLNSSKLEDMETSSVVSEADREYRDLFENLAKKGEKEQQNESTGIDLENSIEQDDSDEEFRVVKRRATGEFEIGSSPVKVSDTTLVYRRTSSGRLLPDSEDEMEAEWERAESDLEETNEMLQEIGNSVAGSPQIITQQIDDLQSLVEIVDDEISQSAIEDSNNLKITQELDSVPLEDTPPIDMQETVRIATPQENINEDLDKSSNLARDMELLSDSSRDSTGLNNMIERNTVVDGGESENEENLEFEKISDETSSEGIPITDLADRNESDITAMMENHMASDHLSEELNGDKMQKVDPQNESEDVLVLEDAEPLIFEDTENNYSTVALLARINETDKEIHTKQDLTNQKKEEITITSGVGNDGQLNSAVEDLLKDSDEDSLGITHKNVSGQRDSNDSENDGRKQTIEIDESDKKEFQQLLGRYFVKDGYSDSSEDTVELSEKDQDTDVVEQLKESTRNANGELDDGNQAVFQSNSFENLDQENNVHSSKIKSNTVSNDRSLKRKMLSLEFSDSVSEEFDIDKGDSSENILEENYQRTQVVNSFESGQRFKDSVLESKAAPQNAPTANVDARATPIRIPDSRLSNSSSKRKKETFSSPVNVNRPAIANQQKLSLPSTPIQKSQSSWTHKSLTLDGLTVLSEALQNFSDQGKRKSGSFENTKGKALNSDIVWKSHSEIKPIQLSSSLKKAIILESAKTPISNRTLISTPKMQSATTEERSPPTSTDDYSGNAENAAPEINNKRKFHETFSKNARRRTWHPDSIGNMDLNLDSNPVLRETVNKLTSFGEILRGKIEERSKSFQK
ncbi:hypothetical protein HK103_004834 [Boothiomyces macroporosus]|uniref:Uncharacterized protein n=1 Tax=Boothiomyces macroporosus TaxID=261099 RepID=A0AAD5Y3W3_9FUNG|nr:hypothetical protein HK103_004834 [Boothiomyces macroporosus]